MRRNPAYFSCVLVVVLLALAGCASGTTRKISKTARAEASAAEVLPPLSDRQLQAYAHYSAGLSFDLREKPDDALEEYLLSAQADPGYEPVVLESARRLLRARQFDRAVEFISKNLAKPNPPPALYSLLGPAYASLGKTNLAIEASRVAVKRAPLNLAGYIHLSQLYGQQGRTNETVQALAEAARQASPDPAYWLALTELLTRFERQKFLSEPEAKTRILAATEKAAKLKPEDPVMRQRIGDLYLALGEGAKAEAVYADLLKEYPDQPVIREKLTNLYLRSGKKAEAAALLESLRRDNPTDPQAYYFLGAIAFEAKDYPKAAENYEMALRLNPSLEQVYYDLAGLRISMHQPTVALEVLERARGRGFKLNFTLEFYSGVALGMMEKHAEALNHFTSAEILGKANEPLRLTHLFYYQMGSAQERVGNIPDAIATLKRALELKPDYAEAQNYLGYMWAERGENLAEARALIEKAVQSEPDNAAFLDSMAWVLHQLGDHAGALKQIKLALAKSSDPDATLLEHQGDILSALNQKTEAAAAYQQSLKLQPSEKVREKLRRLGLPQP